MFTIIVGDEDELGIENPLATFSLPEALLNEESAIFKAASCNSWEEALIRVIKLPEVEVSTFNSYILWASRQKVAVDEGSEPLGNAQPRQTAKRMLAYSKLWLLADRLADTELRNAVMDSMASALAPITLGWHSSDGQMPSTKAFPQSTTTLIWSSTTRDRAFRRFVLDCYGQTVTYAELKPIVDSLHPEFIKDLMLEGATRGGMLHTRCRNPSDYTESQPCRYHERDEKHPSCGRKPVHSVESVYEAFVKEITEGSGENYMRTAIGTIMY